MADPLNTTEIRTYLMEKDGISELIRRTMITLCDEVDEHRGNGPSYKREAHNRAFQQSTCESKCYQGPFDENYDG